MKITGAEFKEWYESGWPGEDWYHETDIELYDNDGKWLLAPNRVYNTS